MIAQLSGKLSFKSPTSSVLDCHGVGYEIFHTPFTAEKLTGENVTVYIHSHIREDAFQLFAFTSLQERSLFRELLKVNGVGPKVALSILSGIPYEQLLHALSQKDTAALQRIPGVGKKTAERLAVELSDRLREWESRAVDFSASLGNKESELESVLLNLGYQRPEIQRAVKKVRAVAQEKFDAEPLESLVKLTLKEITLRPV